MRPYVDKEACIGCSTCIEVCPAVPNVFFVKLKSEVVHPEACIECGACVDNCPTSAIELKD